MNQLVRVLKNRELKNCLYTIFVCTFALACSKNGSPSVKELIVVQPPTFSNSLSAITLTTASQAYTLSGFCDSKGYGLEYSLDNSTYQDVPGGCTNGTFSLPLNIVRFETVYVRSLNKTSVTAPAIATIRFALPPNAPLLGLVQGSTSGESFSSTVVMQSTTSGTMTGIPTTDGNLILNNEIVGVAYDSN